MFMNRCGPWGCSGHSSRKKVHVADAFKGLLILPFPLVLVLSILQQAGLYHKGFIPPAETWNPGALKLLEAALSSCGWKLERKSVEFNSVAQSCPTLCDPIDWRMPGFPVHYQLLEFSQTHVHQVSDAMQHSHPQSSPSPPIFHLSLYQGLFQWVSSLHQVAKVLEFQLQHQSFQWIFRTDFL